MNRWINSADLLSEILWIYFTGFGKLFINKIIVFEQFRTLSLEFKSNCQGTHGNCFYVSILPKNLVLIYWFLMINFISFWTFKLFNLLHCVDTSCWYRWIHIPKYFFSSSGFTDSYFSYFKKIITFPPLIPSVLKCHGFLFSNLDAPSSKNTPTNVANWMLLVCDASFPNTHW